MALETLESGPIDDEALADEMRAESDTEDTATDDDTTDETFFLPASFPGIENYKAGEKISLQVVGKDKDGDLEVKCLHGKDGDMDESGWEDEMRSSMKDGSDNVTGGY